jgi:hypothetical protein
LGGWLVGWLVDWLVGWLAGWLIVWLASLLGGCFVLGFFNNTFIIKKITECQIVN